MKKTIFNPSGKGHFEIQFDDNFCDLAIYDKPLNAVIDVLAKLQNEPEQIRRVVKSITWIED